MADPKTDLHGVFKRPQIVSVEITPKGHRKDAAACVSLSKSTMSMTSTGELRPRRLAPGGGEGRCLVASFFSVNRAFQPFCGAVGAMLLRAQ
jgi:hypothetical protein